MKALTLLLVVAISALPIHANASKGESVSDVAGLVGDWSGTSLCQVKPSACHDENVIFRFSHPHDNKITVQADKVVDGKPVTMGSSEWTYDEAAHVLTWQIPRGTWKLVVEGNEMNGTLVVPDNITFRRVHLAKLK